MSPDSHLLTPFRSLRYMIFYFLKELCASPSRFRLYFFTPCVVIKLFIFCPQESLPLLFFCYSLPFVRFLFFCYSLTAVNFRLFFPRSHPASPPFSFLRFGSAKVKTFSSFPKLIFFIFLSLVCRLFYLSFLSRWRAAKVQILF